MSKYPILTSSQEFCSVCEDSPPINVETRAEDKLPLTVYGRNGSYQVGFLVLGVGSRSS